MPLCRAGLYLKAHYVLDVDEMIQADASKFFRQAFIIATAREYGYGTMTRDRKMLDYLQAIACW